MTAIAQIVRLAQEALAVEEQHPRDLVTECQAHYGDTAWREADLFHKDGRLPNTIMGLELLAVDIKLEEDT